MSEVLENITSSIPDRLKRERRTTVSVYFPVVENYSGSIHIPSSTREHYFNVVEGYDTSVKRITKNRYTPAFVNFIDKVAEDLLLVTGVFYKISEIIKADNLDEAILLIFRTLENWLVEGNHSRTDTFLDLCESKIEWNEDIYIAILSCTLPWKKNLVKRNNLYELTYENLLIDYDNNFTEVDYILSGLK